MLWRFLTKVVLFREEAIRQYQEERRKRREKEDLQVENVFSSSPMLLTNKLECLSMEGLLKGKAQHD
jgi:hypothetical protein